MNTQDTPEIDYVKRQVEFLRARGHVPHEYEPTEPYSGCMQCGQGPGALQHNNYLVKDYLRQV